MSKNFIRSEKVSSGTVRIVSHNAFWFQGTPYKGDYPEEVVPVILSRLTAFYRTLAPDVLCLQEIQNAAVAAQVGDALGMECCYLPGRLYRQYGVAIYSPWPLEMADIPPISTDRAILHVKVNTHGNPIYIANVHLPSGRQRGQAEGAKQRLREIAALIKQSQTIPLDYIVGDFNESASGPCSQLLSANNYVNAKNVNRSSGAHDEAEDILCNLAESIPDQIWLSHAKRDDVVGFRYFSRDELTLKVNGKTHLSDHVPVYVDMAIANEQENKMV